MDLHPTTDLLWPTLEIMGKGMLSIFLVILVIYLLVQLMLWIGKRNRTDKD